MENKTKLGFWKILFLIILSLLILLGLFGAGCGGYFTYVFLSEQGGGYQFYILSIPLLVIGLLLIVLGYKGIRKILKGKLILKKALEVFKKDNDVKQKNQKIEY